VTGAGRGIGRGVALALASEGASVCIAELDEEAGNSTAEAIHAIGGQAIAVCTDVRSRDEIDAATRATLAEFGSIDILVNNAQAMRQQVSFEETTDDDMNLAYESGALASFRFMQACFPYMKQHGGKIVNFASAAGLAGVPGWTSYAFAKEGIRALTKVAAQEWGRFGINVNVICPLAHSEGSDKWGAENPQLRSAMVDAIPLRRLGDAQQDIGPVVVFLTSSDSDFVTGMTVMADGGQFILH